ncbi:hypothetical protein [Pectobacterium carotovorum]|uniref:hypothetical protein n=1 Tax=Pectobacterium carotovorum TaxID=554 RepID=UPI00202D7926|nr:hypothetical protein [Pectobacterium carotovorum]MCL6336217.1 hypothetical protein [Pectobacterium carotovorum subsp. carotovorum]MCL6349221.1 hypothetical protein [Pectobacterium carotovorum subsp. carotovorum]MCL6403698.1 hypothetical protein [Pectobacterium carotovorum subsp. carotovorum]
MRKEKGLEDAMNQVLQAQAVLSVWVKTMTTDDDNVPDMIDAVMTILDGVPDVIAEHIPTGAGGGK